MKLTKVKIEYYKSIVDSTIDFSHSDNITSFIGQNESGKSSILEGLRDFYQGKFNKDSFPYELKKNENIKQSVCCTFEFDQSDIKDEILKKISDFAGEKIYGEPIKIRESILNTSSHISITFDGKYYEFDANFVNLFSNSLEWVTTKETEIVTENIENKEPESTEGIEETLPAQKEPPSWDMLHHDLSVFFVQNIIPEIIFFEGGKCDMLPDFLTVEDLVEKKGDGWIAVDRLEKCLQELKNNPDFSFPKLAEEESIIRQSNINSSVGKITADFKEDFSQKIHGIEEDSLSIVFNIEKRAIDDAAEVKDYRDHIDFAVKTKPGRGLPVRMRSQGMIWFLSFWLALKSLREKKSIILVDEPDKNLHINAQKDLLSIFEKITRKFSHQVIYATHAPSLVPLDVIYRIYLVFNDKDKGTLCENILKTQIGNSKNKQEAISLVNYAIGCEVPHQNMVFKNKNVILEGTSDLMYFQAMSHILNKTIDYVFIPGVGTKGSKLNPLISICIGYNLKWCVVLDGDEPGIGKFNEIKTSVFADNENGAKEKIINLDNHSIIEDLFTADDIKIIAGGQVSFQLARKPSKKNNLSYIGKDRKNTFAKLFLEKVLNGSIKKENLSKEVIKSFECLFDFIEKSFNYAD